MSPGTVSLPFQINETATVTIDVVDTTGTAVRTLVAAALPAGQHVVLWDLGDDAGHPVAEGIYRLFMEVTQPGAEEAWRAGGDVLLEASGVGVGDPAPAVSALAVRAFPNPFNPRTTLHLALPRGGPVDLAVYDLRGRRVRGLLHGEVLAAGRHDVVWDGCDDGGQALASGIYVARAAAAGSTATTRVVLLK